VRDAFPEGRFYEPCTKLGHVGSAPVDGDDQIALAKQHRGAPHSVVGHPEFAR
jgi:hypothetical protein